VRQHAGAIAARFPDGCEVLELGSGSAAKTRLVLAALLAAGRPVRYTPVDISQAQLEESARELAARFPSLEVRAIAGEYQAGLEALARPSERPRLVLFLGSNIGNFDRAQAAAFVGRIASALAPADRVLLGIDRRRPAREVEAAYDDAAGVTARFNLNLLARINQELDGDFRLDRFRHRARWEEAEGRVAMYLDSTCAQTVRIGALGRSFAFAAGEPIHTESSYKYAPDEVEALARAAGLAVDAIWEDGRFAVNLLRRG
jgi:dimethylhistidine N-methyltransferase